MKSIVVYGSISGFTRKYAEIIAGRLKAELVSVERLKPRMLRDCRTVIYGGSLHAVGIYGWKKFRKMIRGGKFAKIIVFAVGAAPAKNETIRSVYRSNFTPEEGAGVKFYYLRGGFDLRKLRQPYRFLISLYRFVIGKRKNKTPDEIGFLDSFEHPVDFVSAENAKDLIDYALSD